MFGNTSCPYLILEKDVELFRIPFHGDNASLKSLQKGYCFVEILNSTVHTYYRCYTCLSYLNFPLASTQLEYLWSIFVRYIITFSLTSVHLKCERRKWLTWPCNPCWCRPTPVLKHHRPRRRSGPAKESKSSKPENHQLSSTLMTT